MLKLDVFTEGLKNYPRHATAAKLQMQKMQEMEQLASIQGLPTDRNTINKLMAMHPELDSHGINNHQMVGRGGLSGSAQAALALTTYQNILMRQNSMNSNPSPHQQEASSSFNNSNYNPSPTLQGTASLMPGSMQNSSVGGFSSVQQPLQKQSQQLQQHPPNAGSLVQQNHPQTIQSSQAIQQQMIQQLLQMSSNSKSGGAQQQPLTGPNANRSMGRRGMGFVGNTPVAAVPSGNLSGSNVPGPSRSNSFKAASNSESSAGNSGFNQKASDLPQDLHLPEGLVDDIGQDFPENGFINNDLDEDLGYVWKA